MFGKKNLEIKLKYRLSEALDLELDKKIADEEMKNESFKDSLKIQQKRTGRKGPSDITVPPERPNNRKKVFHLTILQERVSKWRVLERICSRKNENGFSEAYTKYQEYVKKQEKKGKESISYVEFLEKKVQRVLKREEEKRKDDYKKAAETKKENLFEQL